MLLFSFSRSSLKDWICKCNLLKNFVIISLMPNDVQRYVFMQYVTYFFARTFLFVHVCVSSLNCDYFTCFDTLGVYCAQLFGCSIHCDTKQFGIWRQQQKKGFSATKNKKNSNNKTNHTQVIYIHCCEERLCCVSPILSIVLGDFFFAIIIIIVIVVVVFFAVAVSIVTILTLNGRSLFTWKFSRFKTSKCLLQYLRYLLVGN